MPLAGIFELCCHSARIQRVGHELSGRGRSRSQSEKMLKRFLLFAAVLALSAPAGAAFAQQWAPWDDQHAEDHQEHGGFHEETDEAHARAHEEGFYSRREHRAYHRALRDIHGEFHDEHPGTRHDGYRLPSRRSYGSSYGYYGYPYGYGQYDSGYRYGR